MGKARAAGAAVQNGDTLGYFSFQGTHSTDNYVSCGQIVAFLDGSPSGSTVPCAIRFLTMAAGGSLTERLRISSGGAVSIAGTAPSLNAGLFLNGGKLAIKETTTPTADTDWGKIYTKADNKLYFQSGDGVEHEVAYV